MTNIRPANDDSPVTDRPDIDELVFRIQQAEIHESHEWADLTDDAYAALSDLAARARERDEWRRQERMAVHDAAGLEKRAEAAEADRDAALDREAGTQDALDEMRRRVTELEGRIEAARLALLDNDPEDARAALAGDGVDREALSSERERQGLTDSAGIARTELAGDGGGA